MRVSVVIGRQILADVGKLGRMVHRSMAADGRSTRQTGDSCKDRNMFRYSSIVLVLAQMVGALVGQTVYTNICSLLLRGVSNNLMI